MARLQFNSAKASVFGRVGRDPDLRYSKDGETAICRFSVASSDRERDGKDHTNWFDVTVLGKVGEMTAQQVQKGDLVYVDGPIKIEDWVTKEGEKRTNVRILADVVTLTAWRKDQQPAKEQRGDNVAEDLPWDD